MTLDLVHVAEQLPALLDRLRAEHHDLASRTVAASALIRKQSRDVVEWRARLESARTRWPLALPLREPPDAAFPVPLPLPERYAVVAVDGSHIDVDRHAPARCFVLNLGWSVIFYGVDLPPMLLSQAELQPSTSSLVERDETDASAEMEIKGEVLTLLRGVREIGRLAGVITELPDNVPAVALLDGNLGLWNVQQAPIPQRLRERLIHGEGGLRPAMDSIRAYSDRHELAFGAYTSAAGTSDVIHALRVAACPLETVNCAACPGLGGAGRPCDEVGVPTDADLFRELLAPGERSAVFQARSRSFLSTSDAARPLWYEEAGHTTGFFYLRIEDEIARVELPLWEAERPERLELLHRAVVDQCEKGPAYPVALQEAHEQAVITTVDRRSFAALLDRELSGESRTGLGSAKSRSKRMRSI